MSRRKTGPSKAVVELVVARCDEVCEICGAARFEQIHHRRARGMGGTRRESTNAASALLALCRQCHALVESERTKAIRCGWLVDQYTEPRMVGVVRRNQLVFLDDEGGVRDAPI